LVSFGRAGIDRRALTDVDVTKSSQSLAELRNLLLVNLDLLALLVLVAALLLGVEAQVLEENDLAVASAVHGLLDLLADAVLGESYALAEKLLELGNNRLEAVLLVGLSVGTAEVGHQDDSLGAVLGRILDRGQSTDNALVVCDVLVGVEGNVEVDLEARRLVLCYRRSKTAVRDLLGSGHACP
jgi:hypothetical protein